MSKDLIERLLASHPEWYGDVNTIYKEAAYRIEQLRDRCAELEEENAELEQRQQWQPIETAPKDGTTFDIWVKSHKNESYGVRMTNVYFNNGVVCGRRYPDSSFGEYATHWMPLPDAPAIDTAKGGA